MTSIKSTQSETVSPKKDKKSQKRKFLTNIFHRKKSDVYDCSDKIQTTSLITLEDMVQEELREENKQLYSRLQQLETQIYEKDKEILDLGWEVKQLETKLASKTESNEELQRAIRERDNLRQNLQKSENENAALRLEITFLQDEKKLADKKLKNSLVRIRTLKCSNDWTNTNIGVFKTQYVNKVARMEARLRDVCDELSDLTEQNKLLIRNGLKGKPDDFRKLLKVTQEYILLQAEKNRLVKQMGKLITRTVVQDVFMNNLIVELLSVSELLQKAGIEHSCENFIRRYEELRADLPNSTEADLELCNCSDCGGDDCNDVTEETATQMKTVADVHAPLKKDNKPLKDDVSKAKPRSVSSGKSLKMERPKQSSPGSSKGTERSKDGKGDQIKDEKISIPLKIATPLKKSPKKRSNKTTEL